MRVVLGVGGGIAAYKVCNVLRLIREAGHDVTVVPTAAALNFVGAPTWAALSGKPVATDVWDHVAEVPHVRLGQEADLVFVAPATADLLARAAAGLADDLLTNILLTARCPVLMAPAMHTEMWEHPATQANVATLTARGVQIVPPAVGRLTGADSGAGRLPEPAELYAACAPFLAGRDAGQDRDASEVDLTGTSVVVSAGGTREPLDPVRYLGNRSSGKQGHAIADVAARRGADVTLVTTVAASAPVRDRITVVEVETAQELHEAVFAVANPDVIVMAAAVADFRPATYAEHKIKKSFTADSNGEPDDSAPAITLVRNPDVLAELVSRRGEADSPVIVGFAAETGDESGSVLDHARAKLVRKGCDLLVVNEVGADLTFGSDDNTVTILRKDGSTARTVGPATKEQVAAALWDAIAALGVR